MEDNKAISNFREYVRIPSVHPNIDYSECVRFLKRLGAENGLKYSVYGIKDYPIVVLTWEGKDKNAGSILLNSHMDVVPVCKENWKYDPFDAFKDNEGNIYGRGTQDTKCTGIQHIAAIARLKEKGVTLKRTVHISFVPDEELGGMKGMNLFVKNEDFKRLNVAFTIDEGLPSPDGALVILNDERCSIKLKVHCTGPAGHGSLLHANTAGEKLHKVLNSFMDYRDVVVLELQNYGEDLGKKAEITTINLTEVEGGIQNNVVPPELILGFDIRLSVHEDNNKFYKWVEDVCKRAGDGVYPEYTAKNPKVPKTPADSSNPFWPAFKGALDKMKQPFNVIPSFGTSDSRFLRNVGVPTFGFCPVLHTPFLFHADNEVINEANFLKGIDIFFHLIKALGDV